MSYKYEVGVTFKKEDWEESIYPQLKSLDGTVTSYSGRKADTDWTLSMAEKTESDDLVTFRWNGYEGWGRDPISNAVEQAADEYEADFTRIGEANDDVVCHENLAAGEFEIQSPTLRGKDEPHIEQCDRIITKLMQTCMEKGMTVGKLTQALEGVANKDIVKLYASKAKELTAEKARGSGR
ncbi:MAG: hypothetical protein J6N51_12155 [Selenomonas sp.]|nr:hypothetical protein [Selenomonas sp.]